MKLKKKKLNKDKSAFKRRGEPLKKKKILIFGTHGMCAPRAIRMELIYFVILRKIIKRNRKYVKDKKSYPRRMWFVLKKNYIVSKKSKNARMGKGKGNFLRYAIYIRKNTTILEFYGWHIRLIKNITWSFSKKLTIPFNIIFTKNLNVMHKPCNVNKNYSYQLVEKFFNKNLV